MSSQRQRLSCWVVTAGVAGMENQCLGLAAALGTEPVIKRVSLRAPWKQLSPFFRKGLRWAFTGESDSFSPPWPDVVIVSGRAGAMAALYIQKRAAKEGKKVFTVHIQNPVIDPSRFDLVAVPRHDQLLGESVITTRGSLHRVTEKLLAQEAEKFASVFDSLPHPRWAVMIGGSNSVYQLTPEEMTPLAQQLASAAKEKGAGLMITTSRRTGLENVAVLKEALKDVPHILWDGEGDNPYYAMLALADALFVTADSVNMTSEACSTGKPVYVLPLTGGSEKFRRFHQTLRDDGMTRRFEGKVESWAYTPLNDVVLVANRVWEKMG